MHCDCGGDIMIDRFDYSGCGDEECCGDLEVSGVVLKCKECEKVLELNN